MPVPRASSDEAARLAALRSYEILDTAPEPAFDALTRLAASVLAVPVALVALVDADRLWFKSHHGFERTEVPRAGSLCADVVADAMPLVVNDTSADHRYRESPLVSGPPQIRFYAGMPLCMPDGFVLGTLCALDHVPSQPTAHQLELLALLAGQVVDQLETRRERLRLAAERASALDNTRRLSTLFDTMVEGVFVLEGDGVIRAANATAARYLGVPIEQLIGSALIDTRSTATRIREDGSPIAPADYPALVTLRTGEPALNFVMGIQSPGGDQAWLSVNCQPVWGHGDRPSGVVTTFRDVTAGKLAQQTAQQLSRQEQLVTIGTLAAGVGHEINNPLAVIVGNVDIALDELGARPELAAQLGGLREAREGAERIRKIVRGLSTFARGEGAPVPTDVTGAIDIAVSLAAYELRHKAKLDKQLARVPAALTDESRLSQVLVSLVVNAAQAFPTGDIDRNRITIRTGTAADGRVAIEVIDNGPGIPPELLQRIFEPFFTTKPVGKGTGLGLSISQNIITALGGELAVESAVGHGATFRILLPVATELGRSEPAAPVVETGPRGRVLVIDDEPGILSMVRRILGRDHEVIALGDPREALAMLESGDRFDVVFCDLMMPHLRGDTLHARIELTDPASAARFVFMTGGATDPQTQQFIASTTNEHLEKPFRAAALRAIVRRLVGSRGAA